MIDTAKKRKSLVSISFYPCGPGVTPNASKDQEWRQAAGYSYSGIEAEDPAPAVGFAPIYDLYYRFLLAGRGAI